MAQHLIHRTLFDLRLPTAKGASDKQHQAAQLFHGNLLKVMEEVFDQHVPDDRNWRFDKLEIDLGSLDLNDKDSWQISLRDQLTTTLLDFKKKEDLGKKRIINDLERFIYFLKTGRLPWWSSTAVAFDPSEKLIALLNQEPDRLLKALKALFTEGGGMERWIQQCSEKSRKMAIEKLAINAKPLVALGEIALEALFSFIKNTKKDAQSVSPISSETLVALKKQLAKFYLEAILSSDTEGGQIKTLWQKIIYFLNVNDNFPVFVLYFKKHYLLKTGKIVPIEITNAVVEKTDFNDIVGENQADKQTPPQPSKTAFLKTTQQSNKKEDPESLIFDTIETDNLFIHNAGLILIAPFFRHLFESLGFIENKAFLSVEIQQRAVLLSQYLVTHEKQLHENQLVLNKLLCGYPLDETLSSRFEPTETEQSACTELYETIRENWLAMQRTSEGVFRNSFLQRIGKLQKREADESWQLTVERQSIDVLFETVPPKWSFSFIKLPWMVSPIWTEW
jgi:Contractile injection system tape measure protein